MLDGLLWILVVVLTEIVVLYAIFRLYFRER